MFLTIGVHNWDEVEVVVVDKRSDVGVLAIARDELVCQVLNGHGGDPLAGVNSTTQSQIMSCSE